MEMIEITMYTTCVGVTKTDAVDNVLSYLGVKCSEMKVRNHNSILIIDPCDVIKVMRELLKLNDTIAIRRG